MPVDDSHPHDDVVMKRCVVYEHICMRSRSHFVFVFAYALYRRRMEDDFGD